MNPRTVETFLITVAYTILFTVLGIDLIETVINSGLPK